MVLRPLFLTFVLFASAANSLAQSLVGADLDGDGAPDFVLVTIESDQSLSLSAFSGTGSPISVAIPSFGVSGDHLALANWASASKSNFGWIHRNGSNAVWNVRNDAGATISKTFGTKYDQLISGADFNGNGLADAAVVQPASANGNSSTWVVRYDYFKNINGGAASTKTKSFHFGKNSDLLFFANYDGKGDWVGALRANSSGAGSEIFLNSVTKASHRHFKVTDFTPSGIRPLPIRQASGKDILALIRRQTSSTIFKFVDLHGSHLGDVELPATGEILVGDFLADPGQEVAIQTDSGFLVHNPLTGNEASVAIPNAIPIDDVNINTFKTASGLIPCDDETLASSDGPDGYLWKPKGEHSGKVVTLLPNAYTGQVDEMVLRRPTGEFIEKLSVSYIIAPGSRTFGRGSHPGSYYPANVHVVAHLAAGCYKTWVIPNPSKRTD